MGLAEGLTGKHVVQATSIENLFVQFPVLSEVIHKLSVSNNVIAGFAACDG